MLHTESLFEPSAYFNASTAWMDRAPMETVGPNGRLWPIFTIFHTPFFLKDKPKESHRASGSRVASLSNQSSLIVSNLPSEVKR